MAEINHYHDNQNLEYRQRILQNETSCIFCEINKKEILVQCKECDKLFCNGRNEIPKSHIIFHLQKSSHKVISLFPYDKIIQCDNCEDNNIFNLYYLKESNQVKVFCRNHIPKNEEKNVIPYVGENNELATDIVHVPSNEEDIKKLKEATLNEINKRENLIEELLYVTNRFLNKVKDKYDDKEQYYCIHKPLILCELEYARKICENKQSYRIKIKNLNSSYRNKPLFSFNFNQSHSRPFKIGNVYNFTKSNSENKKSLGLVVNIEKSEYFIIPIEKERDKFENGTYSVREEFCSVPYDRMIAGLDIFIYDDNNEKISKNLTKYILGEVDKIENEEFEVSKLLNPFTEFEINGYGKLNSSQEKAIKNTEKHVLNLIQGPPGTGKTFTASFLIYNIFLNRKNKEHKILVCAPTNAAADNLALSLLNIKEALLKNNNKNTYIFKILRIVARTREYIDYDKKVEDISLHNLVDYEEEDYKEKSKNIIDSSDIVITTCSSSMIDKLENYNFEFVIIDETTQSQEVETLLTMLKGSKHVTLIGDPKQLSPTILHPKGKQTGMHISLFERIMKLKPDNNILLTIQYRMHPKISEFISNNFYEGKLKNGVNEKDRTNCKFNNKFDWPNSNFPIIFINVEGKNKISSSGTSYINEMECYTLLFLIKNKFPKEEIKNSCIITPYLGQKELLEEYLNDYNIDIEVSSIDAFQGKERDFVIINTVRNNKNCEIGFLKDVKRLNVSISRAKYGLIIIGNVDCLYNAKIENKYSIWRKYIEYLKNNKALVTYNMTKNTFERYVLNKEVKKENKDNKDKKENDDNKDTEENENKNVIIDDNEENYEEKYDYDGSKNNYKSNLDLIYKHSGDSVSDQFYYNPIKQNDEIIMKIEIIKKIIGKIIFFTIIIISIKIIIIIIMIIIMMIDIIEKIEIMEIIEVMEIMEIEGEIIIIK